MGAVNTRIQPEPVPAPEEEEDEEELLGSIPSYHLEHFTLFKTRSNFYMVGRDKTKRIWRVLKINRLEPSELVISEDHNIYSWRGCYSLLKRMNEGNRETGGLKFVTYCFGIVGSIRFLGPHYIILITKRRKIGDICGHPIYAISKYDMIRIPHCSVRLNMVDFLNEYRYKKLLHSVDLREGFFFSYSYPIMHRLQRNLLRTEQGLFTDGMMFVWNDFLTSEIHNHLKNTLWTVALVHGFFQQIKISEPDQPLDVTLIARRSCRFAGPRFLKRGVNKEGEAANDVEIEQIISEGICRDRPYKITSIVQNRGSIPLRWSQKSSFLTFKPRVTLSEVDKRYNATKLHFQSLHERYGDPVVILNLVKKREKQRRESVLHEEFGRAVASFNTKLAMEDRLQFWSLDLDGEFQREGGMVFSLLKEVATNALDQVRFFCCQLPPFVSFEATTDNRWRKHNEASSSNLQSNDINGLCLYESTVALRQSGILRSNCVDCLDRTNVAQFVVGLVTLGRQLYAVRATEGPELDLGNPLAHKLMGLYEAMGDAISWQYGGSPARSKIFSQSKGQCKLGTQFLEFLKTLQRHWSNTFLDFWKQAAVDMFLGLAEMGEPEIPFCSESDLRFVLNESQSDDNLFDSSHHLASTEETLASETDLTNSRYASALEMSAEDTEEGQGYGSCYSCVCEDCAFLSAY